MNNQKICHNWVYNPNTEWYNRSSNLSYDSHGLYSYRSVLAKNIDGAIHINREIASYSSSSRKQANHLRSAIPSSMTVFEYDFTSDPLEWYLAQIMDLLDKQTRATKVDYTSQCLKYLDTALVYMNLYKYDLRKATPRKLISLNHNRVNMLEVAKVQIEATRKKKLSDKKKYDKLNQAKRQAILDQFTGGGVTYDPNYTGVYLRVNGDELETTNSITVHIAEATVLYKRWVANKNIVGLKLDWYTVVSATSKQVKIGCTLISANELHRIFKDL